MTHLKFAVFTNPKPGREAEFFDWYEKTHLPHVLALEGVRSVARFDLVPESDTKPCPGRSLAIFDWDIADVGTARGVLARAREAGRLALIDAMETTTTASWFFTPGVSLVDE